MMLQLLHRQMWALPLYTSSGSSGPLSALNIMHLGSAENAILRAVIFNALIIITMIPKARGIVKARKDRLVILVNDLTEERQFSLLVNQGSMYFS